MSSDAIVTDAGQRVDDPLGLPPYQECGIRPNCTEAEFKEWLDEWLVVNGKEWTEGQAVFGKRGKDGADEDVAIQGRRRALLKLVHDGFHPEELLGFFCIPSLDDKKTDAVSHFMSDERPFLARESGRLAWAVRCLLDTGNVFPAPPTVQSKTGKTYTLPDCLDVLEALATSCDDPTSPLRSWLQELRAVAPRPPKRVGRRERTRVNAFQLEFTAECIRQTGRPHHKEVEILMSGIYAVPSKSPEATARHYRRLKRRQKP